MITYHITCLVNNGMNDKLSRHLSYFIFNQTCNKTNDIISYIYIYIYIYLLYV